MSNEQRATSNELSGFRLQTPDSRLQTPDSRLQTPKIARAKASVPARSSRAFSVVANRNFGAIQETLRLLAVCCLSVCFLTLQLGCNGVLSTGSSIGDTSASTSDASRPAPILLTDWFAKDPEAFKTPEQPHVIDAGIVFAGRPTYLCYPIEKFGITNADDIIDITTSCECVTVEKVKYEGSGGGLKDGLRLSISPSKSESPSQLLVLLTLSLRTGGSNSCRVRFDEVVPH